MEKHPHSPARQDLNRKRLDRTALAYFGRPNSECDSDEQRIIYDFVMMEDALCDLIYADHYVEEAIKELLPDVPREGGQS